MSKPPQKARVPPPDLVNCTRIEVRYHPPMLRALGLGRSSIFTEEENRYLASLRTIIIDDPSRIGRIAEGLRSGSYKATEGVIDLLPFADFTCYRGAEHLVSFESYGSLIRTRDGHYFEYTSAPIARIDVIPQAYPLYLRNVCATNLYSMGAELRNMAAQGMAWPAPDEWNDVLFGRRITSPSLLITDYSRATKDIGKEFACPGAGEGKCHYAMNPACKPESSFDTVLLFETKAGWNQHGGRELFTFDNHDPKGGLVLLNDGTVKFIRTEEELKQLRWK